MKKPFILGAFLALAVLVFAHDQKQKSSQSNGDLDASTESMGHGHHHAMGPHMHMSALRDPQPGDEEKAQRVADDARQALEKYKDYKTALADGYKIFSAQPAPEDVPLYELRKCRGRGLPLRCLQAHLASL